LTSGIAISGLPSLPPGGNLIGSVGVSTLPSIPPGGNLIGEVTLSSLPALSAGSAAIGSVVVTALPALPAGSAALGSVAVTALPPLPAGSAAIGSVTVSNLPANQAVSWSGQSIALTGATISPASTPATFADTALVTSDYQNSPYQGAAPMTVGTTCTPGRGVGVYCTVAGNVEFQFANGSTLLEAVFAGRTTFPYAVTQIVSAGTTATATYQKFI
jgi:hypothetical protein